MSTAATSDSSSPQGVVAPPSSGVVTPGDNSSSMKWVAITLIAVGVLAACALAIAPEMGAFSASLVTQNAPLLLLVETVILGACVFHMYSMSRRQAEPASVTHAAAAATGVAEVAALQGRDNRLVELLARLADVFAEGEAEEEKIQRETRDWGERDAQVQNAIERMITEVNNALQRAVADGVDLNCAVPIRAIVEGMTREEKKRSIQSTFDYNHRIATQSVYPIQFVYQSCLCHMNMRDISPLIKSFIEAGALIDLFNTPLLGESAMIDVLSVSISALKEDELSSDAKVLFKRAILFCIKHNITLPAASRYSYGHRYSELSENALLILHLSEVGDAPFLREVVGLLPAIESNDWILIVEKYCENGNRETMEVLLELSRIDFSALEYVENVNAWGDQEAPSYDRHPLYIAMRYGQRDVFDYLLSLWSAQSGGIDQGLLKLLKRDTNYAYPSE